jgi:hypothetical protein
MDVRARQDGLPMASQRSEVTGLSRVISPRVTLGVLQPGGRFAVWDVILPSEAPAAHAASWPVYPLVGRE